MFGNQSQGSKAAVTGRKTFFGLSFSLGDDVTVASTQFCAAHRFGPGSVPCGCLRLPVPVLLVCNVHDRGKAATWTSEGGPRGPSRFNS
jgi:hypothetical protein